MKLILCCDYGLDDALATLDVLSHAAAEGFEPTLVPVGGNVPAEVALRNAKRLLANCDFSFPPVTVVDTTAEKQPFRFLKNIHGDDGMGNLFGPAEADVPTVSFADWIGEFAGEYALLSLGPMTLVPRILSRGECKKFVFMGGNVAETPNYEGYEFNHALDRAAFSEAVKFPHVAVTMDTCRHPLFNIQEQEIPPVGLMRRVAARTREMTFVSGEKGCYVWDDIAAKVLRHPAWFTASLRRDPDGNLLNVAEYGLKKPYLEILEL